MTKTRDDVFAAFDAFEDTDFAKAQYTRPAPIPAKTWPCTQCGGSGKWRSRSGYSSGQCFACKGEGKFTTSPEFRAKKKAAFHKGQETKANNLRARREDFEAANPGVWAFLREATTWSSFAVDMLAALDERGELTERQLAAVNSMRAKVAARNEAKQAERTTAVDLSGIFTMFDKARENGLKKLVYRANGLKISPAKEGSANAGGLYVKTNGGEYLGKVMGGKFIAVKAATDEHKATLNAIAADPSKVARDYGKETGSCCCCGRELTDPTSIAMGIGPVCADNWGL